MPPDSQIYQSLFFMTGCLKEGFQEILIQPFPQLMYNDKDYRICLDLSFKKPLGF
jgi:hypothetical protein